MGTNFTSPELLRKTTLELYELDIDQGTIVIPDVMPHESREGLGNHLDQCGQIRAFGGFVISAGQRGFSTFGSRVEERQLLLPFSQSENMIRVKNYDPGLAQRIKHPLDRDRVFAGPYVANGVYFPNAIRFWEIISEHKQR